MPIRHPAPSGLPCPKGSDCTIVTGFRTVLLAAGGDRSFGDAAFAMERFDANGRLDPSFGADGKVRTSFEAGQASAAGLAVMPDGRFVVAGDIDIGGSQGELVAVARYRPDGTLDPTFGTQNGVATTTSLQQFNTCRQPRCHAQRHPGRSAGSHRRGRRRAVFGGFRLLAAVRYVAKGQRNANFTSDAIMTLDAPGPFVETPEAVVRQSDGKLVPGGWGNVRLSDGRIRSRMIAARFTDLGGLDTTSTSNGFSVDQLAGEGFFETHALFYDPQRKTILVGGFARPDSRSPLGDQFAFVRYSDSGFPDTLFNGNGRMPQNLMPQADHVNAIVAEVGGTLVAGGSATTRSPSAATTATRTDWRRACAA